MNAPPDSWPTVEDAVERIRAHNAVLKAVLTPALGSALDRSRELSAAATRGPLHDVPYVLKDVWDTKNVRTTGGSWLHGTRVPHESCAVHEALDAAGAVMLGKSNVPDHSFHTETDNYLIGATSNPRALSRTAGGSSGGAAAAVASGMAGFDWGSDFGGDIRLPAGFCGVVGVRLSAEHWPVVDHFPPGSAPPEGLTGMGPIAKTVSQCRQVLDALAPRLRQAPMPAPEQPQGVALLLPDRWARGRWSHFEADARSLLAALELPCAAASLPSPREIESAYTAFLAGLVPQLFSGSGLQTARGLARALAPDALMKSERLHPSTARLLLSLSLSRAMSYGGAQRARERVVAIRKSIEVIWTRGQLVLTPTSTHPAPGLGRLSSVRGIAAYCRLANLTDATALSLPWGSHADGLPRSLQIIGPPGGEASVIALAERVENHLSAQS